MPRSSTQHEDGAEALERWIDDLGEKELRNVLKYLVLLNADAVRNAMRYVQQSPRSRSFAGAAEAQETLTDSSQQDPPLLKSRTKSEDFEDPSSFHGSTGLEVGSLRANSRATSAQQQLVPEPPQTNTPSSSMRKRRELLALPQHLLILCTGKPPSRKQGEDQDKAMMLCKKAGLVPTIVLRESRPTDAAQLERISLISHYPQFFLQPRSEEGDVASCTFLGDFDTIHQLFIQGHFNKSILDGTGGASQQDIKDPTAKKSVDDLLGQTSQFRIAMQKRPLRNYEESSDDSTAAYSTSLRGTDDEDSDRRGSSSMSAYTALNVPEHLKDIHQPLKKSYADDKSIDSLNEIFDPPRPPPEDKPLLAAAKRAAEQRKRAEDLARGVPSHLAGLNEGRIRSGVDEGDDNMSLGDDPQQIFDPPRPAPTEKPLLAAAKKAALQLQQQSTGGGTNISQQTQPNRRGDADADDPAPPPRFYNKKQVPSASTAPSAQKEHTQSASASSSTGQPPWMKVLKGQKEKPTAAPAEAEKPKVPFWKANSSTPKEASAPIAPPSREPEREIEQKKTVERKLPEGGACYLVYDAVESELNIYYSEVPIVGAVGVWTSHDIQAFKDAQGLGTSELIGTCASGVQDRQLYYDGWCQFVKAAKSMDARVMVLDVGVPVDFYLYIDGTTTLAAQGEFETIPVDAVACVPKGTDFPEGLKGKKWSKAAKKIGAVATFRALSSKDGLSATSRSAGQPTNSSLSSITEQVMPPPTIQEEEHTTVKDQVKSYQGSTRKSPFTTPAKNAFRSSTSSTTNTPSPNVKDSTPSPAAATAPSSGHGNGSALDVPNPEGGACYLVYEPDSSGRLVEHYSKTPIEEAIGRWVPVGSKKIAGFKFKQNLGRTVLIGNCSAGVQGRKNYCSGWCQYVRSARVMQSEVILWDPIGKGMMVDVFVYQSDSRPSHQTVKLVPGLAVNVEKILAVACIPKNTPFYEGMSVDILKWLADGSNYGASSRF